VILIVIGVAKVLDYLRKDRGKSAAGKEDNT